MPRAAPLSAPSPGDPDRKRVLNVLAQRRYRERRKQKYAALEQQAISGSSASADSSSSPDSTSEHSSSDAHAGLSTLGVFEQGFQDEGLYLNTQTALDSDDIDLDIGVLLDSQNLNNDFDFSRELIPEIGHQPYDLYQTELAMPMDQDMEIPILKTMKAASAVAKILGCETMFWDPTFRWTLTSPTVPNLPPNMQPTPAQLSIPHHPLFDVLPWPQLRTKLICVFALPEQSRPQNARDPMALMQVAFDVEDDKDGFRLNGEGLERDNWEVGEAFFRNWWWALDRSIVETSNAWRLKRGQRRLTLQGP